MRALLLTLLAAVLLLPPTSNAEAPQPAGAEVASPAAQSVPLQAPKAKPPAVLKKCERRKSSSHDYPGASASETYDRLFGQLGGDRIPYLRDNFTPQGLAYWPDWDPANHPGRDLLLVSTYKVGEDNHPDSDSRIFGIDAATGDYLGGVKVDPDHVGGIAVIGKWAFVSGRIHDSDGPAERTVRRYKLSELRENLRPGLPHVEADGQDIVANSSFLGTDGTTLYAGPYKTASDGPSFMRAYAVAADGDLEQGDVYRVPDKSQGMTVVDGDFVYSTSPYGGTFDGRKDKKSSYIFVVDGKTNYRPNEQKRCFRAPSRSEGMVTYGKKSYLLFESGTKKYADQDNQANVIEHVHVGRLGLNDPGDEPGDPATTLTYTGPATVDYHDSFTASARLTDGGEPVPGKRIEFALGNNRAQACSGTTNSAGVAACELTPSQRPGTTTLTVRFAGGGGLLASTDSVTFIVRKQQTALDYTGPKKVANGTRTELSADLTEETKAGPPVAGRTVTLALGRGEHRQSCKGRSDDDGRASCAIDSVDQPLNAGATVPAEASFDGDDFYRGSSERGTVLLEYYTGRSYGLAADIEPLGLLDVELSPAPDTGPVRTAKASRNDPGCVAGIDALLVGAGTLCPKVITRLAPGTSTATAAVEDVRVGLPGLPLVEVEGATARSTSTCAGDDSASGTTDLRLRIAGELVDVEGKVNAEIDLAGPAKLIVDEQLPVKGAEHGLTVNAVHLISPGVADVVIASATSDVHNCAD